MGAAVGAGAVVGAASAACEALRTVASTSEVTGSRQEWVAAVVELQRVVDVASAAQDAAIVRLALIEAEFSEDGMVREVHRAVGHVALDASAVVSGALCVSAVHAERRVGGAVRLAADRRGGARESGLGGLHVAMGAGRLDAYRASVVAAELEEVPAVVAAGVVAALEGFFAVEDAGRLRRRCRGVLARVSPDLLRQRAVRVREGSGLRRWVEEAGVDRWEGTFPSEDAARAWAAIDALARRYLAGGVCERIDRARAKALTDLVEGSATIETVVTLTVPAGTTKTTVTANPTEPAGAGATSAGVAEAPGSFHPPAEDPADLVEVTGLRAGDPADLVEVTGLVAGEPVLVERAWVEHAMGKAALTGRQRVGRVRVQTCDPHTGALVDPAGELSTGAYRPGQRLAAFVKARDGRCRFPGCHVAARFCDLDHVRPWPAGPTATDNLICLCRRHHRIKQRPGWNVELKPDATLTWTDPTGRRHTTFAIDALRIAVLHPAPGENDTLPTGSTRTVIPDGPHTPFEFALEHHLGEIKHRRRLPDLPGGRPRPRLAPVDVHDLTSRHLPVAPITPRGCRRRRTRTFTTDPPPF